MIARLLTATFLVLIWLPDSGLAETAQTVAPVTYTFAGKDAAAAIQSAVTTSLATADSVKIIINGAHDEDVFTTASQPISAEIDNLELDKTRSLWQAMLLLKTGSKNLPPIKVAGHYEEMTQLPVLKHRVGPGEIISEGDIEWQQQPVTRLKQAVISDTKSLIGKTPKHMISQSRPIRDNEVAEPAMIDKGKRVTLLYKAGNIEIKTLGEAMESGAKDTVIRVKNVASKAIITGSVITPDMVRVSAPASTTAGLTQ